LCKGRKFLLRDLVPKSKRKRAEKKSKKQTARRTGAGEKNGPPWLKGGPWPH